MRSLVSILLAISFSTISLGEGVNRLSGEGEQAQTWGNGGVYIGDCWHHGDTEPAKGDWVDSTPHSAAFYSTFNRTASVLNCCGAANLNLYSHAETGNTFLFVNSSYGAAANGAVDPRTGQLMTVLAGTAGATTNPGAATGSNTGARYEISCPNVPAGKVLVLSGTYQLGGIGTNGSGQLSGPGLNISFNANGVTAGTLTDVLNNRTLSNAEIPVAGTFSVVVSNGQEFSLTGNSVINVPLYQNWSNGSESVYGIISGLKVQIVDEDSI